MLVKKDEAIMVSGNTLTTSNTIYNVHFLYSPLTPVDRASVSGHEVKRPLDITLKSCAAEYIMVPSP